MTEEMTLEDVFITESGESTEDTYTDDSKGQEEDKETSEEQNDTTEEEQKPTEENTTVEDTEEDNTEEAEDTKDGVINELSEFFGYKLEKEYEDSVEGLKEFTSEIGKQMAVSEFEQLPEDVKEYMQYRINGGEADKFFKVNFSEPDYTEVELTEDNIIQQKEIVKAFYNKQGFSEADTIDLVTSYEESGILQKQAEKILPQLANSQKLEKEKLVESQLEQVKADREESKKAWETIEETVNSGELQGIVVPEAEKKKFFEWMALPNKEGKSGLQEAEESMSLEQMLTLRYLLYKDINFSKLVTAKQNTKKAESLKVMLNKGNNTRMKGSKQAFSKQSNVISLEDQF